MLKIGILQGKMTAQNERSRRASYLWLCQGRKKKSR